MGIIDKKTGAVLLLEGDDLLELRHVPGHAEDSLRHNEDTALAVLINAREDLFEVGHVVMLEHPHLPRCLKSTVDNASVGELVHDNHIVGSDDGRDRADNPEISVVEQKSRFLL